MVADQNHSSDSALTEQERQAEIFFRYEKIAKRTADMGSALSEKMGALNEKMDNYYSEYKRSVKRLERDVKSLEREIELMDDCVDRDIVVNLIHEIVPSLIGKKGKDFSYSFESSEDSDEWIEEMSDGQVTVKRHRPKKKVLLRNQINTDSEPAKIKVRVSEKVYNELISKGIPLEEVKHDC